MVNIQLIKPFSPDETMDWHSVSLDVNRVWEHKDPAAAVEFRRFIHRDFALGAIYPLTVIGIICAPILTDTGYYGITNYAISAVALGLTILEYYNHLLRENTKEVSLVRRRSQIVLALGICLGCTVATFDGYYNHCASSFQLFGLMGLPRPGLTPHRIAVFCQEIMNPFALIILSILVTFALTPLLLLLVVGFQWACMIATRFIVTHRPTESGEDIAVKILMVVTLSAISLTMLLQRYRAQLEQFEQAVKVVRETISARQREEELDGLLCSMLPASVLTRLTLGQDISDSSPEATVLLSDIVNFTLWSSTRSPRQVAGMLNALISDFDTAAQAMSVEKVKTIGDAYWCFTGLPEVDVAHAAKMCEFAMDMMNILVRQNEKHPEWKGVSLRIGLHSGPLDGAILGSQQLSYEVFGVTNDVAGKVERNGMPMRIAVTGQVLSAMSLTDEVFQTPSRELHQKTMEHQGSKFHVYCCTRAVLAQRLNIGKEATVLRAKGGTPPAMRVLSSDSSALADSSPLDRDLSQSASFPQQAEANFSFSSLDQGDSPTFQMDSSGRNQVFAFSPGSIISSEGFLNASPLSARARSLNLSASNRTSRNSSLVSSSLVRSGATNPSDLSSSHLSSEDSKAKRRQFLQDQARKVQLEKTHRRNTVLGEFDEISDGRSQFLMDDDEDISVEIMMSHIAARRYNWFLFDFLRPETEAMYLDFVMEKQRPLRRASRVCSIGLVIAILISTAINQAAFSVASIVLFGLALLMTGVDCVFCMVSPGKFPLISVALHHVSALSLFLAAGLMNSQQGSSVATNDITYLHAIVSFIVSVGNVGLAPACVLVASNLVLFVPCVLILIWKTVMLTLNFVFLFLSNIAFAFALVILERQYRQQFVDQQVALHFTALQEQRKKEQEALLLSMVPPHVIRPLMRWLAVDLDPSLAYVRTWTKTCVAFVNLAPPVSDPPGNRTLRAASISRSDALSLSSTATPVQMELDLPAKIPVIPNFDNQGPLTHMVMNPLDKDAVTACDTVQSVTEHSTPTSTAAAGVESNDEIDKPNPFLPPAARLSPETLSPEQDSVSSSGIAGMREDGAGRQDLWSPSPVPRFYDTSHTPTPRCLSKWLLPLHVDIDTMLKKYKHVVKIKTMGDTIMLAGPFQSEGQSDPTTTAATTTTTSPEVVGKPTRVTFTLPMAERPERQLRQCQDQMLVAIAEVSNVALVKAGIHVGAVAGAVMGNNRLCFDIFGDTVNVASRAMTAGCDPMTASGDGAQIIVSEPFYTALRQLDATTTDEPGRSNYSVKYAEQLQFSDRFCRRAKGKGDLLLRAVQHLSVALPGGEKLNVNLAGRVKEGGDELPC